MQSNDREQPSREGATYYMNVLSRRGKLSALGLLALAAFVPGVAVAQSDDERANPEGARPTFEAPTEAEAVPGQVIVKFEEDATEAEEADARRDEGLVKEDELELIDAEVVEVRGQSAEQAVRDLERRPDVEYAEPDYIRRPTGYADEPRFRELWGLNNTGQSVNGTAGSSDVDLNGPEASTVTQGNANLVVAVIDDGVDFTHPDLAGRKWVNPGESGTDTRGRNKATNRVDDDKNGYVDDVNGWDFVNNDNTVHNSSADTHGTHVAGTIAASVNGAGVVGVAPNVKIMALNFLGSGPNPGLVSDEIEAIEYATKMGVRISNNSYGAAGFVQAEKDAIDASGQLFVAAAGNGSINNDTSANRSYPASYTSPNILSVAAIDNGGGMPKFSNFGAASVDIAAPGVSILSTVPGRTHAYYNGTSMATPHATGVGALAASANPALLGNPAGLKKAIMDSGKPAPSTAGRTVTGDMVDARGVTGAASTTQSPAPGTQDTVAPRGRVTINGGAARTRSAKVTLSFSASDNAGGTGVRQMRIRNAGRDWSGWQPYTARKSWNLPSGRGNKVVYAQFRDGAGNASPVARDVINKTR